MQPEPKEAVTQGRNSSEEVEAEAPWTQRELAKASTSESKPWQWAFKARWFVHQII